jgi:hypothetical protein
MGENPDDPIGMEPEGDAPARTHFGPPRLFEVLRFARGRFGWAMRIGVLLGLMGLVTYCVHFLWANLNTTPSFQPAPLTASFFVYEAIALGVMLLLGVAFIRMESRLIWEVDIGEAAITLIGSFRERRLAPESIEALFWFHDDWFRGPSSRYAPVDRAYVLTSDRARFQIKLPREDLVECFYELVFACPHAAAVDTRGDSHLPIAPERAARGARLLARHWQGSALRHAGLATLVAAPFVGYLTIFMQGVSNSSLRTFMELIAMQVVVVIALIRGVVHWRRARHWAREAAALETASST